MSLRPTPALLSHLEELSACRRCPKMFPPVVVGRATRSPIYLVGQAPGDKEPKMGRPFAWTAGRTLFKWLNASLGWTEDEVRDRIYFAAVCRCFPGKKPAGGDRVPAPDEIENCSSWMEAELRLLKPQLVLAIGKLAADQFLPPAPLTDRIGKTFRVKWRGREIEVLPLPHPSGASPWHRMEPGITLLNKALAILANHPAVKAIDS
jgi:uracil-DNA glycosylase